jgi:hypothetical protein
MRALSAALIPLLLLLFAHSLAQLNSLHLGCRGCACKGGVASAMVRRGSHRLAVWRRSCNLLFAPSYHASRRLGRKLQGAFGTDAHALPLQVAALHVTRASIANLCLWQTHYMINGWQGL